MGLYKVHEARQGKELPARQLLTDKRRALAFLPYSPRRAVLLRD